MNHILILSIVFGVISAQGPPGKGTPPPKGSWSPPPKGSWSPPPKGSWTPPPKGSWSPPPKGQWTPPPKGEWTPPPKDGWTPPAKGSPPSKGSWTPPEGGWTPPEGGWTPPEGGFTPPSGGTGGPNGGGPNGGGPNGGGPSGSTEAPIIPDEQPTEPTACTDANAGRCECADTSEGFQTYTFWLGDVQRCFTVFHPNSRASEVLPVLLAPNCYAKDKLSGIEGIKASSDGNAAATRYGFARIGISTPDGGWTFGNDGVVNDEKPMPCSDEDSKDMPYLRKIFEFIESSSSLDDQRIYAQGFSQNSMFSAYIGFCFNQKVLGVWQGGSGMALTGMSPNLPGCQGQVTASDFANECSNCNQCITSHFCDECQYWPIYPCYSPVKPMVDCVADYFNDMIANDKVEPESYSSAIYMYERLVDEGHDARLLRFSPSDDGTIAGQHQDPKNKEHWQVGCLGITAPCSQGCETAFIACVDGQNPATASDRATAFETCMDLSTFQGLGCDAECAPTYNMLASSETPTVAMFENFGAGSNSPSSRPAESLCIASSN